MSGGNGPARAPASLLSRLRERQDTRGNRARIEDLPSHPQSLTVEKKVTASVCLELNRLSTDGT